MMKNVYKKLNYNNFNHLLHKYEVKIPVTIQERFENTHFNISGKYFLLETYIKKRDNSKVFFKLFDCEFKKFELKEIPEKLSVHNNSEYFALWNSEEEKTYLYDINDTLINVIPFQIYQNLNNSFLARNDDAYVSKKDLFYLKIANDGNIIWKSEKPCNNVFSVGKIAWNDDFIFFYRQELIETQPAIPYESPEVKIYRNSIVCISQANGKLVWEKDIENLQLGRPILLCDNIIVIKSNSIGLLGLDTATGQILWNWKLAEETYNKRKAEYKGGGYYFEVSLNTYEYTIDYEGKLHIVDFETYSQLNVKTGAILATFDFEKAQKKWKLNRKPVNTPGGHFGLGATPTVTKDYCIAAIRNTVVFINKNTGGIDYTIPGEDKLYGGIKEIALIGENRLLVYEGCGTRKMPDNILKIWEGGK